MIWTFLLHFYKVCSTFLRNTTLCKWWITLLGSNDLNGWWRLTLKLMLYPSPMRPSAMSPQALLTFSLCQIPLFSNPSIISLQGKFPFLLPYKSSKWRKILSSHMTSMVDEEQLRVSDALNLSHMSVGLTCSSLANVSLVLDFLPSQLSTTSLQGTFSLFLQHSSKQMMKNASVI
jgi:hypothetical protein